MLVINVNTVDIEDAECMMKIAIILDSIRATTIQSITGEMTSHEVTLIITTISYMDEIKIAGKWNEETEEMTAFVWHENIPVSHFNFHPIDSMGGFDLKQFKEEVKKITQ